MARLQGDIASKKADIDLKTKEIEIKAQQADRDAMLDLAKHAADGEVEPETAEEEIPLVEQVSSTISYKDAPPSIKRQMEAEVGFKPATAAEAKLEMDAKKQEAKPKPVLSKPKKN
jgi:predicted RNA-binding protein Jag